MVPSVVTVPEEECLINGVPLAGALVVVAGAPFHTTVVEAVVVTAAAGGDAEVGALPVAILGRPLMVLHAPALPLTLVVPLTSARRAVLETATWAVEAVPAVVDDVE